MKILKLFEEYKAPKIDADEFLAQNGWLKDPNVRVFWDSSGRLCATQNTNITGPLNPSIWVQKTNGFLPCFFGNFESVSLKISNTVTIESWQGMPSVITDSLTLSGKTPTDFKGLNTTGYRMLFIESESNINSLEGIPIELPFLNINGSSRIKNFVGIPKDSKIEDIIASKSGIESLKGLEIIPEMERLMLTETSIRSLEFCPIKINSLYLRHCFFLKSLKGLPINKDLELVVPLHLEGEYKRYKEMIDKYAKSEIYKQISRKKFAEKVLMEEPKYMDFFFEYEYPEWMKKDIEGYKAAKEWA